MIDDAVSHITRRLRQIARELSVHSKYIQEKHQITMPQLMCLLEIRHRGPLSLGRLTELLYLNNSTITGIIDRLEKRNLVRRIRTSSDRRQIHVELTEEGRRFVQSAPEPIQDQFILKIKTMEKSEVDDIIRAVDRLAALLSEASATEHSGGSK